MITNTEMWKLIFERFLQSIVDPRIDISLCAIRTFFSLINSNSSSLDETVISFLANECFQKIIDILCATYDNPEFDSNKQLGYHELAHCGRILWQYT